MVCALVKEVSLRAHYPKFPFESAGRGELRSQVAGSEGEGTIQNRGSTTGIDRQQPLVISTVMHCRKHELAKNPRCAQHSGIGV